MFSVVWMSAYSGLGDWGGESLRHELQTDFFFPFALCLSMCTLYVYCKYNVTCNYTLWLDFS